MARIKKSNRADGRYQIKRVVGKDYEGKAIYKHFYGKSKQDAENKYTLYLLEIKEKEKQRQSMPFDKWAMEWLYTYKEPDVKGNTFDSTYYRPITLHLIPHFKDTPIQQITQTDIKAYFNKNREYSASTLDKDMLCLKGMFETAIDNDMLVKNPCRNVKFKSIYEPKKKRTYDKESVEKLCSVKHEYAPVVVMLLRLGLRESELCGLKWESVDFENRKIKICNAVTRQGRTIYEGKTKTDNSTRVLPMTDEIYTLLENTEKIGAYVFHTDGKRTNPSRIYERLDSFYIYLKIEKGKRLSPHELRHTCGTLLYKETKDIYHVSRFLGHSDIKTTTKTYVHSDFQDEEIHLDFD